MSAFFHFFFWARSWARKFGPSPSATRTDCMLIKSCSFSKLWIQQLQLASFMQTLLDITFLSVFELAPWVGRSLQLVNPFVLEMKSLIFCRPWRTFCNAFHVFRQFKCLKGKWDYAGAKQRQDWWLCRLFVLLPHRNCNFFNNEMRLSFTATHDKSWNSV